MLKFRFDQRITVAKIEGKKELCRIAKVSKFYFIRVWQLCVSKRIMTFETFGVHRPSKGNSEAHE